MVPLKRGAVDMTSVRGEKGGGRGERGEYNYDICDKYGYSLIPRLLPSFLSHTVQKNGRFLYSM